MSRAALTGRLRDTEPDKVAHPDQVDGVRLVPEQVQQARRARTGWPVEDLPAYHGPMAISPAAPSLIPLRWTVWRGAGLPGRAVLGCVAGVVAPRVKG